MISSWEELIMMNEPAIDVAETALLSEPSLAEDWNRPEEDAAYSHLQQPESSMRNLRAPVCSPTDQVHRDWTMTERIHPQITQVAQIRRDLPQTV
jgi:hypothetical protein